MHEVSIFFFRAMQLACFLSGFFMLLVSTTEILGPNRNNPISGPRWYFGMLAWGLGCASILIFLPRLLDRLVFWLSPPELHIGPMAVTALLLIYSVSGGLFCLLCGRPRRSLTVFLLILTSSLMSTYLEFL